jgi:hypothetical protein
LLDRVRRRGVLLSRSHGWISLPAGFGEPVALLAPIRAFLAYAAGLIPQISGGSALPARASRRRSLLTGRGAVVAEALSRGAVMAETLAVGDVVAEVFGRGVRLAAGRGGQAIRLGAGRGENVVRAREGGWVAGPGAGIGAGRVLALLGLTNCGGSGWAGELVIHAGVGRAGPDCIGPDCIGPGCTGLSRSRLGDTRLGRTRQGHTGLSRAGLGDTRLGRTR